MFFERTRTFAALFVFFICIASYGRVYTGIEIFLSKYTGLVKGKRVGLVTNPTGVNGNLQATADLLKADPRINLTALLAPEHGIRGDVEAGKNFSGNRDPQTGLPIYTLYGGKDHRPTPEALSKFDVLIYNIQDIGCRSYTFIWHLAECMSAAAAAGKTVIVMDVPNPAGAVEMDGPIMQNKYRSFIGLYPIPFNYGLTVGELARYLNREEKINCKLYIVPMLNYRRGMSWEETGLPWVPTSPQIPSAQSACGYSVTGVIGTLGTINMGVGYTLPFQTIAAPWINADHMAKYMNSLNLGGIRFRPIHYKSYFGLFKEEVINGVQIHIIDPAKFKPTTTTVAILCYLQKNYPQFKWRSDRNAQFDKAMGTDSVRKMIQAGRDYKSIVATWQRELNDFSARAEKYKIYK
ncbi:MAG: DUF1343 domain-containing protein [Victivallaceae bacterium]